MIKKILVYPLSGFITPFESDIFLSYIFAFAFLQKNKEIIDIFEKFKNRENPFMVSNGFITDKNGNVFIPKPIFFSGKVEHKDKEPSLKEAIKKESTRKEYKKASIVNLNLEYIEILLKEKNEEEKKKIIKANNEYLSNFKVEEIWKNVIPRFNKGETTPYSINTNYAYVYTIYVKINDEEDFHKFYSFAKQILEIIGFGAGKSRGFGKIKKVELKGINEIENKTFNYLEELKNKGKYLVLNNFKPSKKDLENIDFNKSFIDINWKKAKTLQELNEKYFKGNMNFIKSGSVLILKNDNKLEGDFYNSNGSYNFGFIF